MEFKKKIILILIVVLGFILRIYQVGNVPPSIYWDEASLGYNAFSIAQTLYDEHHNFLPVTNFIAFGDFKPPGYIYLAAIFIKFLGLSEVTTRLPSVVAGTCLILVTYLLVIEMFKNKKLGLITSFVLAISPWAIQMSRGAFEANVATLFSTLGILFFLKKNVVPAAIFSVAAMYTFNSHRIFVPLILVVLTLINFRYWWQSKRKFIVFGILSLLLLAPLIPHMLSREGQLRFNEVSWANDLSIVQKSNDLIAQNNNALWAKILFNRRVFFAGEFVRHYTDHFRPDFLFLNGDVNPRLSVQGVGELYWFEALLLVLGLIYLIKLRNKTTFILLAWIGLGIIPAAVARETPHALRILSVLPAPQILIALGITKLFKLKYLLILAYPAIFLTYLSFYYFTYPKVYAQSWQYGYKEAISYTQEQKNNYERIYISDFYGRPYIYVLFYGQYQPQDFWQNGVVDRDWYGFRYVKSFDKYVFGQTGWQQGKNLYVLGPNDDGAERRLVKTITDPYGNIIFRIFE